MNTNTLTILGSFRILALVLFFPCCLQTLADERPPDLCIVLVDSLRPDHLGCYGYGRETSPFVDSFAAEGTLFEQAMTPAPWTQSSVEPFFFFKHIGCNRLKSEQAKLTPFRHT